MKFHFSKNHWRSLIEEIHTGAFFPDGRIPVDCISGVKSAFGVHLEKKSWRPIILGPDPKTTIGRPTSAYFCSKVPLGLGCYFFFFQNTFKLAF
jgi:hypothetical protein